MQKFTSWAEQSIWIAILEPRMPRITKYGKQRGMFMGMHFYVHAWGQTGKKTITIHSLTLVPKYRQQEKMTKNAVGFIAYFISSVGSFRRGKPQVSN